MRDFGRLSGFRVCSRSVGVFGCFLGAFEIRFRECGFSGVLLVLRFFCVGGVFVGFGGC